jgi:hypothetical protein
MLNFHIYAEHSARFEQTRTNGTNQMYRVMQIGQIK